MILTSSGDGLAVEVAKAGEEQQRVEKYESDEHGHQGKMRELGNHRSAKTFAGVDEGIYEHGFLENGEFVERAPGIVGTAEKDHGRDDETEHEADVGLLHAAAERKATGRGEKSHEQCHKREEQRMRNVEFDARAEQQPGGRNATAGLTIAVSR